MSLTTEPLTRAFETADASTLGNALAADVAFRTPILAEALQGEEITLRYLAESAKVITDLSYYETVGDDELSLDNAAALPETGSISRTRAIGASVLLFRETR